MRSQFSVQFRVLYRVFLLRVVDLEVLATDGDPTKLLGQLAALLAAISFCFTAWLILVGGRLDAAFLGTMAHLLIATTMAVVGLFAILSWDATFPDKRDVLVLAPLPVPARTIFLAKFSALAFAMGLSILALNVFSGLIWPILFTAQAGVLATVRSFAAYWVAISAGALFLFCSVLGAQGIASQLLPRQIFLRLSTFLQLGGFCLFLGVYILEPSLEAPRSLTAPENQHLLAWLPSYWFLGLFERLNGAWGSGLSTDRMAAEIAWLANRAWIALAIAVPAAAGSLLLSYFRTLRRIVEQPDLIPGTRRVRLPFFLGNSLQNAVLLFCVRALLRSRQHRTILNFSLGAGLTIVWICLSMPQDTASSAQGVSALYLAASILMMCTTVGAIRIVASMPIALRGNWIFRITELRPQAEYLSAVRRVFFVLGVMPVWLGSAMLFSFVWPWRVIAEHLLVLALLGAILVELSLRGFQKIPFTCPYLPGKGNVQYFFWASLLVFVPLILAAGRFEKRMLEQPLGFVATVFVLAACAYFARRHTAHVARSSPGVQFEETNPPEIFALNLDRS